MGVCYFLALRSPTNGFWYPPIAFGKLMLLVYGPIAVLPVLGSELLLMAVQYVLVADVGFVAAGVVSLATTLEAVLAWWLLRNWPIDAGLRRPRDLVRLLVFGGLIPNLAGALLGVALLYSFVSYGERDIAPVALLWALGDFVTTVTWMPGLVLWSGALLCGMPQRLPVGKHLVELLLILTVSAATCVVVAVGITAQPELQDFHLKFLCFLPLIWAGIRFWTGREHGVADCCVYRVGDALRQHTAAEYRRPGDHDRAGAGVQPGACGRRTDAGLGDRWRAAGPLGGVSLER